MQLPLIKIYPIGVLQILFRTMHFSTDSPLTESNKPVWGTCPNTPITDANFQTAINTCLTTNPEDGMFR